MAMLWSDWVMWAFMLVLVLLIIILKQHPQLKASWGHICSQNIAMAAFVILCFYFFIGLLDCIHLNVSQSNTDRTGQITQVKSLLDFLLWPLSIKTEKTYSAPFATHLYSQALVISEKKKEIRIYPRLQHAATSLKHPNSEFSKDILLRASVGFLCGAALFALFTAGILKWLAQRNQQGFLSQCQNIIKGKTRTAWKAILITAGSLFLLLGITVALATNYHVFGTDKIGQDVLYLSIKSIRTGLIIGTVTTFCMAPLAILLGSMAGYFGGWVDDIIQYLYTTLSSIPGVLFISASILVLQIYMSNHPNLFSTLSQRADARLLALCFILGITSWANLCRLLRGETLKLRELDFILAAKSLGVTAKKILGQHIIPNVMHIVIITLVLDFSTLVLAEAVLSYVGVGVDPTMISWGNMINSSRLELAREPIVWWPLLASLFFMFFLVLSMNLFADSVRDALDPRLNDPSFSTKRTL